MKRSKEVRARNERLYWLCSPVCLEWPEEPERTPSRRSHLSRPACRTVRAPLRALAKVLVRVFKAR